MTYSIKIDKKWQQKWRDTSLNKFNKERTDKKLYCLEMLPYPSGARLHVGHWFNFGLGDVWARFKRMQGYEVFQPMGFDAFGLPAENYAIKTGVHPQDSTKENIGRMRKQLAEMGLMCDWDYEFSTCDPEYYRWTQWLFVKLYQAGLAYRKQAPVNWCPSCQTVLANEQVIQGECERCSSEVTKKNLTQWFFKITDYAEELLQALPGLDWPEQTKKVQTNWIGKSVGAEVNFSVDANEESIAIFTTRVDTLFGATFLAIAPEHPLLAKIVSEDQRDKVRKYQEQAKKISEIERLGTDREKTGVFTGAYAKHPSNDTLIPIWTCDYVLSTYGTGCVMGVPAHDVRDYIFAQKYDLPIIEVIEATDITEQLPIIGPGLLINSGEFDGLDSEDAKQKIIDKLALNTKGIAKTEYRLRDWLVSRQRYWGAPIPILYCDKCGVVPVPDEQLPVTLPYDVEFTPDGESPLKKHRAFMETTCPTCGGPAERDADTLDTFVDSAWYYLRYPDNKNDEHPFSAEITNQMLPVDKYIGGAEHATMHLLYVRFIAKALRDLGYVNFDEPFVSLLHQGLILGPDGEKMSKSKGNTVSPDEFIEKYGADVFRMSLMFGYSYTEGGPWSEDAIRAIVRFVARIERMIDKIKLEEETTDRIGNLETELDYQRHMAIKHITDDVHRFQFNTVISKLMELCNALYKYEAEAESINLIFVKEVLLDFVRLLAPAAPHLAEELWESLGADYSVSQQAWPKYDPNKLIKETIEWGIQINGAIRHRIEIASTITEANEIETVVLNDSQVQEYLAERKPIKVIVVPKKMVNIVVK